MDESETTERERKYYKSWQDRLDKGETFKDFSLFRPKILTMWNTSSYASGPGLEAGVDKDTLDVSNDSTSQPSTKTAHPRKLRKRVILAIAFGIGAIVAALVPVVLIFYLPKAEPSEVVSTVEVQASVQNKKFTEALDNKNSLEYRNFTSEFCSQVEAVYKTSDLKDTYDGCLVTDLRNGSIIVIFQVVFIAKVIPTEIQIKSSLLSTTKETTDTGQILVTLGVFLLEESTVVVGTVTIIEAADNPVPKIAYGNSCRVTSSCKTDWAECSGQRCTCPSSRYISHQSDSCFMLGSILGGKCSATCSVSHAECDDSQDPVCVCSPGYYNKDETCESKIAFEDPCVEAGPTDQCATFGAGCTNNKCSCNETHFYYQQNDTCLQQIPFEDPCVETGPTDQCKSHGAGCNNNKCNCEETHFHYSKNDTCLQLGSILGEACSDGCDIAYAVCDQDQESICICDVGYYKKDGTCEQITAPETSPTTTTKTQATSSSSKSTSTTQISSTAKLTESTSPLPSEIMSQTTPPPSSLATTTATSSSQASFTTVMTSTSLETQTAILTTNKMAPTSTLMMTTPTSSAGTITSTMTKTITTVPSSERLTTSSSSTLRTTSASSTKMTKTVPATTLETQTTSTSKTMAISPTTSTSQTATIKSDPSSSVTASNSQTSPQSTTSLTSAAKTVLTSLLKSTMSISVSTPTTMSTPPSSEKSSPTSSTTITTPTVTKKPSSVSLPLTTTVMETSTLSTRNKAATTPTETTTQTSSTVMPPSTTSTMTASQTSPATATKPTVSTTATPTHMSTGGGASTSLASPITTINTPPTTTPSRPHSLGTTVSIAVSAPATMSSPTPSRRVMTPTLLTTDKISTSSSKETTFSLSSTTAPLSLTSISTKTESTPITTLTSSTTSSTPSSFTSVAASISSTTQLISSTKALTPSSTYSKSSLTSSTHIIVPTVTAPTVTTKLSSMSLPLRMTSMKASTSSTVNKAATTPTEMTTHISSTVMPPSTKSTTASQTTSATAMKLTVSTTATPTTMSARTLTSITLTSPITTMTTPPTTTPNSPHSPTSGISPNINLFVPGLKKLEIGKEETIACAIYNIEHVATAKLERTVGEVTELICSLSKSDTESDLLYGDGKNSHMSVDVLMLNSDKGANITLSFDPVQCSDSATYRCSVIARDESVDTEAKSEHVDVYKPPLLELNFPFELREGTYGLNVGCSASLGYPRGDLIMQRKLPGESIFTLYEPVVQKEAELRWIESNDTTNTCITDVRYDFDTPLEGWNMTEFRCAINVGTETEMYSDAGVFEIVPKSVCSGKGVGENVQHPFNCKLYITCIVDTTTSGEVIWSYVKQSSCSGDECWLPTGQCGTTQSPTTSTTTIPTTRGIDPYIDCNNTVKGEVGSDFTIYCVMENTEDDYLTNITIYKGQSLFLDASGDQGTKETTDQRATVTYTPTTISFTVFKLGCAQSTIYRFVVNNLLEDSVTVIANKEPAEPVLILPRFKRNQRATVTCKGKLGYPEGLRDIHLEKMMVGDTSFTEITEGITYIPSKLNETECVYIKTLNFTFDATDDWLHGKLKCVTNKETEVLYSQTDTITVLEEQEVSFNPDQPTGAVGEPLSINCTVTGVSGLTTLRIYHGDEPQLICSINDVGVTNIDNIACSGEVNPNEGCIQIDFSTVQCSDEGVYICEPNTEASTPTSTFLTVTRAATSPTMTSEAKSLAANRSMLNDESFVCEAEVGYPRAESIILQSNRNGDFKKLTVANSKIQSDTDNCRTNKTLTVKGLTFDASWNNTKLRCAVEDDEGTVIETDLKEFTIQLVSEFYCNGTDEYTHYPYDCHLYIRCVGLNVYVNNCAAQKCPIFINGTLNHCNSDKCSELCP